jgi:ribonuclease P protein component
MLSPANRLRKTKEIERVFAGRNYCRSGLLTCKTGLNNLNTVRFCFVVSKRVSNNAVVRNKLKRRLREIVRSFLPRIKNNQDYILIASPGLEVNDFNELRLVVEKVLVRARALT